MRCRLSLLSNRKYASLVAMLVTFFGTAFALEKPAAPVPIWSGEGSQPAGSGNQKVFLMPDEHSVIVLWPNQDGTETKRRFDLHNTIYPSLRVHMESSSGRFRYKYDLENGKQSKDSIINFSVIVYPDPQIQTISALWKGGAWTPTSNNKERVGLPGAPPGSLAHWMGYENEALLPGAATSFTLTSQARPGFTSASTEHFPHIVLTDEWPDDTADQMDLVLDPKWIAYHFITLGPRYGPDDPATRIASDYIVGIQELVRIHRLESNSPFMKEVIADLDAISAGSSTQIPVTQKPHSEMEAEILNALQLSLHVTYNGPQ